MEIIDNRHKRQFDRENMEIGEVYEIIIQEEYDAASRDIVMVVEQAERKIDSESILLLDLDEFVVFEARLIDIIQVTPLKAKMFID